jgi:purine-binding chemotaxis protein CheW
MSDKPKQDQKNEKNLLGDDNLPDNLVVTSNDVSDLATLKNGQEDHSKEEITLDSLMSAIDRKVLSTYGKKITTGFEETKKDSINKETYIAFSILDVKYAIPINRVLEIGTLPYVTSIPKTPSWLLGVTNLRGDIFSVVDLKAFLFLGQTSSNTARMMLVRTLEEDFSTILIVDKVNGLVSISREEIKEPTAPVQSKVASFLTGFHIKKEDSLGLFDLDKLLNSTELRQFEA